MIRTLAALIAALFISVPIAASAQIVTGGPSYAEPADYQGEAQIHGRILSFDGGYNLQVRDEKGYVDNVQLHQGTIINPTGLTLAPGMIVSIMGYNAGPFFAANEVDTPYTYYYGVPYYAGHPWNYYGPSISLGFFFGNPGWWHGAYFGGPPRFIGGTRYYNDVHVDNVYRGGAFRGHDYVAPAERGGYVPHGNFRERRSPEEFRGNRGGEYRGGDNRGGDNRGGDNRGGDNRGGDRHH